MWRMGDGKGGWGVELLKIPELNPFSAAWSIQEYRLFLPCEWRFPSEINVFPSEINVLHLHIEVEEWQAYKVAKFVI